MRVAIVHDELLRKGGAERVVISMHKLYPNADIFTVAYNEGATFEYFKKCNIKTSFLGRFVKNEKLLMLLFFPFGILAFRAFNLSKYDLILLSSAHGAQYIKRTGEGKIINYAHYVFRAIWEPETYGFYRNKILKFFLRPLFYFLQLLDKKLTVDADFYFFNSNKTKSKYLKVFGERSNVVLNPPVDLSSFSPSEKPGEFFLVVSRFQPYKRVDLVIDAFKKGKMGNLVIVGNGILEDELRQRASTSEKITFEVDVSNERLKYLYANCKALIFPQVEDFGITPLECNASGRPVIAYKKGGVLETMVENVSSIFFSEQNVDSLCLAIEKFENHTFDQQKIIDNAMRFDENKFQLELKKTISSV